MFGRNQDGVNTWRAKKYDFCKQRAEMMAREIIKLKNIKMVMLEFEVAI